MVEFSSNLSATKWCAQTFSPIFGLFAIFDRNFSKIVAPPNDGNENYAVHLKELSLLKKCKPRWNRPINGNATPIRTMSPLTNSAPALERYKEKKLETKASSHEGQCIPAGSSVSLPRMVFIFTVSIITMRSRLFPANFACDCLGFAKFRPQFCESCGATYRRICELFRTLQSISGSVTDVENSVQIDA